MTWRRRGGRAALAMLLAAGSTAAQEPARQSQVGLEWSAGATRSEPRDDYHEWNFSGGVRLSWPGLGVEILGQQGLLLLDRYETEAAIEAAGDSGELPVRSMPGPLPRRAHGPAAIRQRIEKMLRAAGTQRELPDTEATRTALGLPRFLYVEGGITVLQRGVLVARAERLWISPLDDRMVLEDVELRYVAGPGAGPTLTVRGPRLVKQGGRWTGRDLVIATCTAGVPHISLLAGEAEIIERGEQFEVWSRGNRLQFSGTSVLPLPDAHFFTGEQNEFPIKRVSAGYSEKEGVRVGIDVGTTFNRTGGAIHEFVTGRPAHEFRGDWLLGVEHIEKRGVPVDGRLTYRGGDLYHGSMDGFYLDDRGTDLREIVTNIDGSAIDRSDRHLFRTSNRVNVADSTHVDLTLFRAGDPAAYSEFFGGDYRSRELPETSAYLHHSDGNRLFTLTGRWNLDDFSYRSNRSLAPFFVEELPVATFQWLSQPIATTPWDTPIVLDAATELGQRRRKWDPLAPPGPSDATFRADQVVEVSAPFHAGPFTLRPFVQARGTWYDEDVSGDSAGRLALEAGVRVATRMSRTFTSTDAEGQTTGIRHVIAPQIVFADRFRVDDDPSEFLQFDATDALDEHSLVRVELRNLLQRTADGRSGPIVRDFLFLDLAQSLFPDASRDNAGEQLGLLEFEFLMRPTTPGLPLSNLAIGVEGDHDWQTGLRTLDAELGFGKILGIDWTIDYRTDAVVDGAVGFGARASMFDRWDLFGGAQFDLQTDEWLHYSAGLARRDHDWTIVASVSYNPFADEVSFRIEFVPRLFGSLRSRDPEWLGSSRLYSGTSVTDL